METDDENSFHDHSVGYSRSEKPVFMDFPPSQDLSFVIGAFLGDGSFVEDSDYHHHVKLAVRDRELADAFNRSVAKVLGRKVNVLTVTHNVGKVYYESKYSSQPLGLFVKRPLEGLRPFADDHPAMFLRGLFSADGCASISTRSFGLVVSIILSNSRLEPRGEEPLGNTATRQLFSGRIPTTSTSFDGKTSRLS